MGLEDLLREAAAKGLTHVSLHPVHSEDNKTVYWRASATPSTMHKYVSVTTTDAVEALTQVLKAMPKAPKRSKAEAAGRGAKPTIPNLLVDKDGNNIPGAFEEVTAAVIDANERDQIDPAVDHMKVDDEWSRFK